MAPELFLAIIAFLIAAGIVAFAWFYTAAPARQEKAEAASTRLAQYEAWLRERLRRADREAWNPAMKLQIAQQLAATREQLVRLRPPGSGRTPPTGQSVTD